MEPIRIPESSLKKLIWVCKKHANEYWKQFFFKRGPSGFQNHPSKSWFEFIRSLSSELWKHFFCTFLYSRTKTSNVCPRCPSKTSSREFCYIRGEGKKNSIFGIDSLSSWNWLNYFSSNKMLHALSMFTVQLTWEESCNE